MTGLRLPILKNALGGGRRGGGGLLSVKRATTVNKKFSVERDDSYKLSVELEARGSFDFDPGRCHVICRADGKELFTELIEWSEKKSFSREIDEVREERHSRLSPRT